MPLIMHRYETIHLFTSTITALFAKRSDKSHSAIFTFFFCSTTFQFQFPGCFTNSSPPLSPTFIIALGLKEKGSEEEAAESEDTDDMGREVTEQVARSAES